ncbi:P-loop containing nucleoside triphosphate hydrolase protein [Laetiporus sulphureus 93-53]|uniref:Kinesin-like protein n=1 Tax=Laetiporus sulphureus 93-53 TaxID=1314785 RepID=A0A165D127_9APHY|nr:P-loop containing nucleoside triphosphate hydrolase protein [Laetiporus sulphureus 93-53]KZT03926.1 P-loop containing nucleoside triphosphate hydrolase protein [Laetiporus sulphureus 93-53]
MAASIAALKASSLPDLQAKVVGWRQKQQPDPGFKTSLTDISNQLTSGNVLDEVEGKDVYVAFRTRPPLENEFQANFATLESEDEENAEDPTRWSDKGSESHAPEKFTIFCPGVTLTSSEPGEFVAHVPGWKWSGATLMHKQFASDIAFGADADNEEVYQRTVVANGLLPLALSGGTACILAYGQTGTGKTYTMEALEHRVARDLFAVGDAVGRRLHEAEKKTFETDANMADGSENDNIFEYNVTFLELLGKRAVDLLEPVEGLPVDAQGNILRSEVPIKENKAGDFNPPLITNAFRSSEELEALIARALAYRRTSATARNATSSRSHAILTIRIKNKLLPYADEGRLILVDLAGSERYEDSKMHDKQRMDESRENNKSLMNLKDSVRAKARMADEEGFVHIPWRLNKLTMLLKPIFDVESRRATKTVIIAHVSPHIQDSVHSVNTLSYAAPFKTSPPKPRGPAPYDPADPRTWNTARTRQWLTDEFTVRARTRQIAAHKVKEKAAERRGKKLRPIDPNSPVQLLVDVDKLCPEGMTAVHFGRMYTTQFVHRCLEERNSGAEITPDVVRNMAAEVIGSLSYLLLRAKTRTRNEIMKSRKALALDAVYGAEPT